jgi:hypothetical protein
MTHTPAPEIDRLVADYLAGELDVDGFRERFYACLPTAYPDAGTGGAALADRVLALLDDFDDGDLGEDALRAALRHALPAVDPVVVKEVVIGPAPAHLPQSSGTSTVTTSAELDLREAPASPSPLSRTRYAAASW